MSISTLHRLDKIVMPSSVEILELTNMRWNAEIEDLLEYPAGHTVPMFVANKHQKPAIMFSTPMLSTLLANVTIAGAALGSTTTYFKKAATTGGSVARASAVHKKIVIASSIIYWKSIKLPHNAPGTAEVVIAANYDGTNDPFVYTGTVALSGNLTATEYFGAGPCSINAVNIPGIAEITIDSGIEEIREGASSEEFDTFVGIGPMKPSITIRTFEMVNWSTYLLRGIALDGAAGVVAYARKFSSTGSRVADATAQHIKFIGLNGKANPTDTNGDNNAPLSDTIRCPLIAITDSTYPLTLTAGIAIT